ncbi:MAG: hypothetical protein ACYC77_01035 [Coriobacteriia bacterium]
MKSGPGGRQTPVEGSPVEFSYKRECPMGFTETIEAVERSVRLHGFVIDRAHDLKATLASKGFDIQPLRIYEITSTTWEDTGRLGEAFAAHCRIHVYEEDGAVYVNAIRPTALCRALEDTGAAQRVEAVERSVVQLVDSVVKC